MKIFISHSSKDKWAARRISEELLKTGVQTFLDEKDIKTGQSIDGMIKNHLKECEDFLIIISPASINSDWVLLELGGALALEKNIIPIMLYVGVNEIPQVINLKLARDINDIELYYKEIIEKRTVKATTRGKSSKTIKKKIVPKKKLKIFQGKFKIGQAVRIISHKPENIYKSGFLFDWENEMDKYMGQQTTVAGVGLLAAGTYTLDIDKNDRGGGFVWAEEWLTPII